MITPFAVLIVSRVRGRQRSRAAQWSSLPGRNGGRLKCLTHVLSFGLQLVGKSKLGSL